VSDHGTRLDVIVVNFHSEPLIGRTVEIARRLAGDGARVIVVDNSPGDGAAEVVRAVDPSAIVIVNPVNRGYASAVNQAFAVADADLVLLINPDVRHVSGNFEDVAAAFGDPRVGAVVPRLLDDDGTLQPSCIRAPRPFDLLSEDVAFVERFPRWGRPREYHMLDWDQQDERQVDAATGACLFIRRAAITDVGPFDERFFVYYEETDWLIRAKQRGWKTVFVPAVEAVHASAGSSPGVSSRNSLLLLESQHRYARKHYGPVRAAFLRAAMLGIDGARLARHGLARNDEKRAAAGDRIRVHLTMRAPRPT
jgi:GT2 family glycosyltransferase